MTREFSYVIYGASGFTGQFVVERLARFLKDRSEVKWAVAGRNEAKIAKALKESGEIIGIDLSKVPIISADSGDTSSLTKMAERATVVINCVGPYRLYGEPVVKACVLSGTSMVDISGEPDYIERMQAEYHDLAKANGCYIVSTCGWDSIPCDLGVDFLLKSSKGTVNEIETFIETHDGPHGYSINSGTYQTILLGIANQGKDDLKALRRKIMPDRVPKVTPKMESRSPLFKLTNGHLDKWAMPFPGSDRSVVQRSIYSRYHDDQQRPVQVQCYMLQPSLFVAVVTMLWAIFVFVMTKFEAGLTFMQTNISSCTFGKFTAEGPSRIQADTTTFTYWLFGKSFATKADGRDANPAGAPTRSIVVRCDGTDPGYNCTAACIVSSAMTIVEEAEMMPGSGGVHTPATAFTKTSLLKRLEECDVTFKVVVNETE